MNEVSRQSPNKILGGCFRCQKAGHWANNCPEKPYNQTLISHPNSCSDYPPTHCRCGAGFCEIRVSHTQNNPNRKYYCCPGKNERYCRYFEWCDAVLKRGGIVEVQPKAYPICSCGAGVARVEIEHTQPNGGRPYFACHLKKGDGVCPYKQWVDVYFGDPAMEVNSELLINEAEMLDAVEMMFSPA
ncbi:unnamed protein product [Amaranthus hypochondriacus]